MRLKLVKILLIIALLGNIVVWHRIWRLFASPSVSLTSTPGVSTMETSQRVNRRLARSVTVVIRQFENFENDVTSTIESVMTAFPNIPILIICDQLPYPPLELDLKNESMRYVKLVNLQLDFNKSFEERNPLFYIRTKFVLFIPDASRLGTKQLLQVRQFFIHISIIQI